MTSFRSEYNSGEVCITHGDGITNALDQPPAIFPRYSKLYALRLIRERSYSPSYCDLHVISIVCIQLPAVMSNNQIHSDTMKRICKLIPVQFETCFVSEPSRVCACHPVVAYCSLLVLVADHTVGLLPCNIPPAARLDTTQPPDRWRRVAFSLPLSKSNQRS